MTRVAALVIPSGNETIARPDKGEQSSLIKVARCSEANVLCRIITASTYPHSRPRIGGRNPPHGICGLGRLCGAQYRVENAQLDRVIYALYATCSGNSKRAREDLSGYRAGRHADGDLAGGQCSIGHVCEASGKCGSAPGNAVCYRGEDGSGILNGRCGGISGYRRNESGNGRLNGIIAGLIGFNGLPVSSGQGEREQDHLRNNALRKLGVSAVGKEYNVVVAEGV